MGGDHRGAGAREAAWASGGPGAGVAPGGSGKVKVLTSCPACLQGLSRCRNELAIEPDSTVTEVAHHRLGEGWQPRFLDRIRNGGIERVPL